MKFRAYLAAVLFSCIIGFSFLFVKLSLQEADPLDVLAHRFTIALFFSLPFLLFRKMKWSFRPRDLLLLILLSVLNPFFYFLTQALGLLYLPASEAGIIQALLPIFTILMASWFLKEKQTGLQKLAVSVSVLGVMFIFMMNNVHFGLVKWPGIVLIMVSTLTYAGYNVLGRKAAQSFRMEDMTCFMIFSGWISFNLISAGNHIASGTVAGYFTPLANPVYLISVSYLGILASFTTFFLSNFALKHMEAYRFGIFTNLTTIISIFAGTFFLHEQLFYYHYIGALMVIIGVIGVNILSPVERMAAGSADRRSS
jgi:drug/metabolite transporter (DMT)-like permease